MRTFSAVLLGFAGLAAVADAQFRPVPLNEFQALEVLQPVPVKSVPRMSRLAMLACKDTMSDECRKVLEGQGFRSGYDDEDWAYGDGYYKQWEDIDPDADIGVIDMPYQLDYDLLNSHKIAISGVKPCGGCSDE
eukprot:CAMPEP_0184293804 /NCGR_PEP_ID=MMETSP1049-20130417/5146_1 /TAXON_ID=77928 /ORGANISM="Proteomonas sulcata, Strain CCMP704" /LENGTH=133 /DNA_ID=CAMNT_0026601881 /DNA_START=40 /DNA_END=441 /DNA_ORIENTATION=-